MSDQIRIEEVDSVEPPPKARVEDTESLAEKLERKKDYLEGFLAQKPAPVAAEGDEALQEAVIYDLGLIYGVEINGGHALVTMTLTTPHCPVAESMPGEVELRVGAVPGIGDAEVNLVWDPPWGPDKMTDEARLELGML